MKCLIAVNLFIIEFCCQLGLAQTNDTYSILKTLDGARYTNAEVSSVTAAYAIVFYDGGGMKIPLTNFPPELQRKYHFDAAGAAALEKVEAEKQAAARAKYSAQQAEIIRAQAPIGDPVRTRILQILATPGQYKVSANGIEQTVMIASVPENVIDFINRMNATREQLDSLNEEQKSQRQYAARQRSLADATEHWADDGTVNPNYSSRRLEANLAEAKSQEQLTQIGELTREVAKMRQEELMKTTILARPTGWAPSSVRVWQFVGVPTAAP
jgi:hypothetical protein